jgi:hypothetical protein
MTVDYGVVIFSLGILCSLGGWWFGRKKAAERRGLDERYITLWKNARATSWIVTNFSIFFMLILYMAGVPLSVPQTLAILVAIHLGVWGILGVYFSVKDGWDGEIKMKSNPKLALYVSLFVMIGIPLILLVPSLLIGRWEPFLYSMIPAFSAGFTGIIVALHQMKKET